MWVLRAENQFSIFRTEKGRFPAPFLRRPLSVPAQPVRTFPKAAKRKESNLVNAYNAVHYRING